MSRSARILVVEDEEAIRTLVCKHLERHGFDCAAAGDVPRAEAELARRRPDLVLLDWMLPGQSGFEYVRSLKRNPKTRDIPVIMLTARGAEQDKVRSLDAGADDHITKPFSLAELTSRVNAVLRRAGAAPGETVVDIAGLRIDVGSHRVEVGDAPVSLGPTEFRLLCFFATHPERVHSRSRLLDEVWGNNVYIEERTVDVHIRRLRKALEPTGHDRLIQTVRGAGYRLSARD